MKASIPAPIHDDIIVIRTDGGRDYRYRHALPNANSNSDSDSHSKSKSNFNFNPSLHGDGSGGEDGGEGKGEGKRARAVPTTVPLREVATFGVHVVPARAMRGSVAVVGELGQDEEEEEGKRERGRETGWGDFSKGPETPEGRETLKVGKVSRRETGDCHTTFTCAGTPDSTRWGGADTIGGGGGGGESRCRLCGEVGRESRGELCDECEYPPRPFMTKKTRR